MADKQKVKQKIHEAVQALRAKKRKHTEGKVNIDNVSAPKKHKPKKVKENHSKTPQPGSVSVGAHGGRYIQEPSGHQRYVKEGQLSGSKKYKKSMQEMVEDELIKSQAQDFVKSFKSKKGC